MMACGHAGSHALMDCGIEGHGGGHGIPPPPHTFHHWIKNSALPLACCLSALLLPSPHLCLSLLLFTLEHKHFPPSSLFNPASIAVSPCLVSSALISTTWEEVKAAAFGLLVSSLPPFLFPVFTPSLARRLQGPSIFSVNLSLLAAYSERDAETARILLSNLNTLHFLMLGLFFSSSSSLTSSWIFPINPNNNSTRYACRTDLVHREISYSARHSTQFDSIIMDSSSFWILQV